MVIIKIVATTLVPDICASHSMIGNPNVKTALSYALMYSKVSSKLAMEGVDFHLKSSGNTSVQPALSAVRSF